MPQMSPLLWMNLYFFFVTVFLLIIVFNFFIKTFSKMKGSYNNKITPSFYWKW